MKVGVITFSSSKDNYGQIIQAYAMQAWLKKLGHEPFLIRFAEAAGGDIPKAKIARLGHYLLHFPRYAKWYIGEKRRQRTEKAYKAAGGFETRDFEGFIARHIDATPLLDEKTLMETPPEADAYICGSDQIWGGNRVYYLSFAPDDAVKIAYAPSLGGLTSFSEPYLFEMKSLMARLDGIGMREQSGVDFCKSLGFDDTIKVVDPTLLLDRTEYDEIRETTDTQRPYAFVYLLGNPTAVSIDDVNAFIRSKGLDMVYVASQNRVDEYPKKNPTIGQWVDYIARSEMVITNSFHCSVFAMLYDRPFITLPLNGGFERMNTRVEELLRDCGLEDNLCHSGLTSMAPRNGMSPEAIAYLGRERNKSRDFICSMLG